MRFHALSRVAFAALVLATPSYLAAQSARTTTPKYGFSPERLARIDSTFQRAINGGEAAGAVALVLRDGHVVYDRAFGFLDKESGTRMTTDAIFRIASQTKALTSIAIMSLVEEGKIALNDPVARFIPAYGSTTVAVRSDTGRVIVPARRRITIRDLLTHSAGISYGTDSLVAPLYAAKGLGPAAGFGWYTADKNEPICETMERLATLPFVAQPGERFVYGYNTDVLGCVVERVSGMSLDQFFQKRITGPLGMTDTHFFLPEAKRSRLVTVYASTNDNRIERAPQGPRGQGDYVVGPRRSYSGGAGLLSTARDYSRLLQMLLNGGTLDGVRILAPKTIDLMTSDQLGPIYATDGEGFGLGFRVLVRPGAGGRVESPGTFSWGGAYGSTYEVDPKERLVLVFMINQLPNRSDLPSKFPMLVYQALVEPGS